MQYSINHPQADEISVIGGSAGQYGDDYHTVEIAFFKDGQWVIDPIEPFADRIQVAGDTAIYPYVSKPLVDAFIAKHQTA